MSRKELKTYWWRQETYLVRHGKNHMIYRDGQPTFSYNYSPLTELGEAEASASGDWLAENTDQQITTVYYSHYLRSEQTAMRIGINLKQPIWHNRLNYLRERGLGLQEGKTEREIYHAREGPQGRHYGNTDIVSVDGKKFPTGILREESFDNLTDRSYEAMRIIWEQSASRHRKLHQNGAIVVVSHAMFIRGVLTWWNGIPWEKALSIPIPNAGVIRLCPTEEATLVYSPNLIEKALGLKHNSVSAQAQRQADNARRRVEYLSKLYDASLDMVAQVEP